LSNVPDSFIFVLLAETAQKTRQEVLEEKVVDKIELDDDSEEEVTVTLIKI